MHEQGEPFVSSTMIARMLRLDSTQVVKDMSYTGISGRTRVGFSTEELLHAIENFLGYNRKHEAFLVGAGYLGSALIQYNGFRASGFKIVAAFDTDKKKSVPKFTVFRFSVLRNSETLLPGYISISVLSPHRPVLHSRWPI